VAAQAPRRPVLPGGAGAAGRSSITNRAGGAHGLRIQVLPGDSLEQTGVRAPAQGRNEPPAACDRSIKHAAHRDATEANTADDTTGLPGAVVRAGTSGPAQLQRNYPRGDPIHCTGERGPGAEQATTVPGAGRCLAGRHFAKAI